MTPNSSSELDGEREAAPAPSIDRALRVLGILAEYPQGLSLAEITNKVGYPKTSLHRTLAALRHRQFVSQNGKRSTYRLGPEAMRVGLALYNTDLRTWVHPLLEAFTTVFGETAHYGVLEGHEVVYHDKVESTLSVRVASSIGGRNLAHATGLGKAMLAFTYRTDVAVACAIREGRILLGEAKSTNTITRPEALVDELTEIRLSGFSVDREENELGVRCVAFPLLIGGRMTGSVSIAGPAYRFGEDVVDKVVPRASRLIAEELGEEYLPVPLQTLLKDDQMTNRTQRRSGHPRAGVPGWREHLAD